MTDRFFVLTGGPGSGKTTLLAALAQQGFPVSQEAGRAVIRQQQAIGGEALPWKDPAAFAELMLSGELRNHEIARETTGPFFFDRGLPDIAGYLRLCGLPVPAPVEEAIARFRYNRHVFIAPPWREIYATDAERHQDWQEAVRTFDAMREAYGRYGYELVSLPLASIGERADFMLDRVAAYSAGACTGSRRPPSVT
jgi:predicted ATPase